MEELFDQKLRNLSLDEIEIYDSHDTTYKPRLYCHVQKFINGNCQDLCTIEEQRKSYEKIYMKMGSYSS